VLVSFDLHVVSVVHYSGCLLQFVQRFNLFLKLLFGALEPLLLQFQLVLHLDDLLRHLLLFMFNYNVLLLVVVNQILICPLLALYSLG